MAHYFSFLCSLSILIFFLAPFAYSHRSNLHKVCLKHKNPHLCMHFLNDDGDNKVPVLAQLTIAEGIVNANGTIEMLNSIIPQTHDPLLMQHYQTCSKCYHDAYKNLKNAEKSLDKNDFNGMNTTASSALAGIRECEASRPSGFDLSASLAQNNDKMLDVSNTIVLLANYLMDEQSPKVDHA